jgi:large subunit ribosomal protein L15
MMDSFTLNKLKSRNGIDRKALGRGIGSGCGKTSSYGHKGGKARSGRGKVSWFEGGQMPLYRRLPKRGFVSLHSKESISCIHLVDLQKLCDAKVISPNQDVDIATLKAAGVVRDRVSTVRLLAKGELKVALQISLGYASDAAIRKVEAAGGKVQIT